MAKIQIGDQTIAVGDEFLKLSPEQQSATVQQIADKLGIKGQPTADKYQQAAQADVDRQVAAGHMSAPGYTERLVHGATLGADSTILAGLATPLEMIKRGTFNPAEGYNYAKAREDYILNKSRENTGLPGAAVEALGGTVAGGGLAKAGLTASRLVNPALKGAQGFAERALAGMADAAGLGGISGAMEGNGLGERAQNAAKGIVEGGLLGGALPLLGAAAKPFAAPFISHYNAWKNPVQFGEGQAARIIQESGKTPEQIERAVAQAAAEGQPQFNVADVLGNAGQRGLSTVARAPGEGRTNVVNDLDARQAGQGRRVVNTLKEGFGSNMTPDQMREAMTAERRAIADQDYGTVRNNSTPVDVSNVIANIDHTISPATQFGTKIAPDSIEGALLTHRGRLTDGRSNLTEFRAVSRVRDDLADQVEAAKRAGQGNRARLLGGTLRELDASMEAASPGFKQANRNFEQASKNISAIDTGAEAANGGRTEDTIPAFNALGPRAQQAYRTGYVDPYVKGAQGAQGFGTNRARPFISDAFKDEAAAIAPRNDLMQRKLGRENTMFETRAAAMGGSKTADNLNDHAAMSVDPHLIGQILTGNYHGAVKSVLAAGHTALTGNTAPVRKAVGDILLKNGVTLKPGELRQMVDSTVARLHYVQKIAHGIGRGIAGGLAIAAPGLR